MGKPRHQREQQLVSTGTYATLDRGIADNRLQQCGRRSGTERRPLKQPRPEPWHALWETPQVRT